MNEDALVETIRQTIDDYFYADDIPIAERILVDLRAEGFSVYRPEECAEAEVIGLLRDSLDLPRVDVWEVRTERDALVYPGVIGESYLMVPVGEGTDDE